MTAGWLFFIWNIGSFIFRFCRSRVLSLDVVNKEFETYKRRCILCFSRDVQQSAETELSAAAVQQLRQQHISSKQHLCHSPLPPLHLLLYSAPERPQHGSTSVHGHNIFTILFLPPGQPTAEYLSDRHRYLAMN